MRDPVDNKKKWQVVATIAFALLYPLMTAEIIRTSCPSSNWFYSHRVVEQLVHWALPAVLIWFLPYKKRNRILVIGLYIGLMSTMPESSCW